MVKLKVGLNTVDLKVDGDYTNIIKFISFDEETLDLPEKLVEKIAEQPRIDHSDLFPQPAQEPTFRANIKVTSQGKFSWDITVRGNSQEDIASKSKRASQPNRPEGQG